MELVTIKNKQAVTTSLKVAEVFGKEHYNVLRDIDDLIESCKSLETNENSNLSCCNNQMFDEYFEEIPVSNGGIKKVRRFVMNRDGFTLLVMGYRGQKAMKFKLAYIDAFNKMEEQIQSANSGHKFKLPQTFQEALRELADQVDRNELLEAKNKELEATNTQLEVTVEGKEKAYNELDDEFQKLEKDYDSLEEFSYQRGKKLKRATIRLENVEKENFYHKTEMFMYRNRANKLSNTCDELNESIKSMSEANQVLTERIEEVADKMEVYNQIMKGEDAHSLSEVANLLNFKNVGRNTLYKTLKELGYIQRNNRPYQKYVNQGYFDVKINAEHGTYQTVVYPKGIELIRKLMVDKGYVLHKVKSS